MIGPEKKKKTESLDKMIASRDLLLGNFRESAKDNETCVTIYKYIQHDKSL